MIRNAQLSLKVAKEMHESCSEILNAFALENYTEEELATKKLPETWRELKFIKGYFIDSGTRIINVDYLAVNNDNKNTFLTKKQAKASIALAQLSQLREIYRNGWTPDWTNFIEHKYVIHFKENDLCITYCIDFQYFLAFQSKEIRDKFINNFKELILIAKPLLG